MSIVSRWTRLAVQQPEIPVLLFKFVVSQLGYRITLTDLTNVWQESLSAADISKRAEQSGCSIRPGNDHHQLQILIGKIEEGLCYERGGVVNLISEPVLDNIVLMASALLPPPLPIFKWRMCLAKERQALVTTEILTPLLSFAHRQRQQITFLVAQLKEKDHVIDRLIQKMESSNTDLGAVFPGMSGIRRSQRISQREQFARHVKGLARFESGSEKHQSDDVSSNEDLYSVFRDLPVQDTSQALIVGDWWHALTSIGYARLKPSIDLDDDQTDDDLDYHMPKPIGGNTPPTSDVDQPGSFKDITRSTSSATHFQQLDLRGGEADNLTAIEAELDALKEEITKLRILKSQQQARETVQTLQAEDPIEFMTRVFDRTLDHRALIRSRDPFLGLKVFLLWVARVNRAVAMLQKFERILIRTQA
ncbi:hypothetical protein MBLNU459_g1350t1 [Dothideomycetes sp. NU459]